MGGRGRRKREEDALLQRDGVMLKATVTICPYLAMGVCLCVCIHIDVYRLFYISEYKASDIYIGAIFSIRYISDIYRLLKIVAYWHH